MFSRITIGFLARQTIWVFPVLLASPWYIVMVLISKISIRQYEDLILIPQFPGKLYCCTKDMNTASCLSNCCNTSAVSTMGNENLNFSFCSILTLFDKAYLTRSYALVYIIQHFRWKAFAISKSRFKATFCELMHETFYLKIIRLSVCFHYSGSSH